MKKSSDLAYFQFLNITVIGMNNYTVAGPDFFLRGGPTHNLSKRGDPDQNFPKNP